MALIWQDYLNGVVRRDLLMVMDRFEFTLQYLPFKLRSDELEDVRELLLGAVVKVLRRTPGCDLHDIHVPAIGDAAEEGPLQKLLQQAAITPLFVIHVRNPVFDFTLKVGESALQITKGRSRFADLIATASVLEGIASEVFAWGEEDQEVQKPCFFALTGVRERLHRVVFRFVTEIQLGCDTNTHQPVKNYHLLGKLYQLRFPPNAGEDAGRRYPLAELGVAVEDILRGDVVLSLKREVNGIPANIWIQMESPWNLYSDTGHKSDSDFIRDLLFPFV